MKWLSLILLPIACSNLFGVFAVISSFFDLYWQPINPIRGALILVGLVIAIFVVRNHAKATLIMAFIFGAASLASVIPFSKGIEIVSAPAITLSLIWCVVFGVGSFLSFNRNKELSNA